MAVLDVKHIEKHFDSVQVLNDISFSLEKGQALSIIGSSGSNRGRPENWHLLNPPSEHGYDDALVTESKVSTFDPMLTPHTNNGRFWDYISEFKKNLTAHIIGILTEIN